MSEYEPPTVEGRAVVDLGRQVAALRARAEQAEARAEQAEARLAQIRDYRWAVAREESA